MDVGQKVVFVRAVKGAEVGKRGTVMKVFDNMVVVDCTLKERLAPVLAQMWDVLPERLWDRLLKRRKVDSPITAVPERQAHDRTRVRRRRVGLSLEPNEKSTG